MIEKIKASLKKRKVKVFLIFLFFSGLAWFLNNLSETYTGNVVFDLKYINTAGHLMLTDVSKNKIDVKLEASGFQFLAFNFITKTSKIDISTVEKKANIFFITQNTYKKQIEKQLSNSMKLIDIEKDTIFFNFQEIVSKELPIEAKIKVNLAQNYLLDDELKIEPNTIKVKGPKNEIDTIKVIRTEQVDFNDVNSDFSKKILLYKPEELLNTTFSSSNIRVTGKVSRFSEKLIEVPVQVLNLPIGVQMKTFPDKVSVLCKAKVDILKTLEPSNFQITVDYTTIRNGTKELALKLSKKPKNIHSVTMNETQVTYILKRE